MKLFDTAKVRKIIIIRIWVVPVSENSCNLKANFQKQNGMEAAGYQLNIFIFSLLQHVMNISTLHKIKQNEKACNWCIHCRVIVAQ